MVFEKYNKVKWTVVDDDEVDDDDYDDKDEGGFTALDGLHRNNSSWWKTLSQRSRVTQYVR